MTASSERSLTALYVDGLNRALGKALDNLALCIIEDQMIKSDFTKEEIKKAQERVEKIEVLIAKQKENGGIGQ